MSGGDKTILEIILKNRECITKAQFRLAESGRLLRATRQLVLSSRRLIDEDRVQRAPRA